MPSRAAGSVLISGEFVLAEVEEQLARVIGSQTFRGSALLHSFLRFVTEKTMRGCAAEINEYTIATQVFGRAPDFNPAADTIVRTQAYRLRQKLDDYYRLEGAKDPIVISIPKGHYIPTFQARETNELPLPAVEESSPTPQPRKAWLVPLAVTLSFALGSLSTLLLLPRASKPSVATAPADPFWQSFLQSDKEPIIAYTNPLYLADDHGDLFVFHKGVSGDRGAVVDPDTTRHLRKERNLPPGEPLYFADDVTGVNDVLAAVLVSSAITHAGGKPVLRRGRLLTTYDLDNHNVVFIGSPFVNEMLDDLPNRPRFRFARNGANHRLWSARIDDIAPGPHDPASYAIERAPDTGTILSDYAILTGLPGLKPNRRILILAGLTTSGTAAAARCATSPEDLLELSRRLPRAPNHWPAYFEYLLKVQLNRGLDVVSWRAVAAHF